MEVMKSKIFLPLLVLFFFRTSSLIALNPDITLSDTSVSIAETTPDSSNTSTFTITNDGDTTLVVTNIESDNTVFNLTPASATLIPGDSQVVTVTFTPARSGSDSATLTVTSNDTAKDSVYVNVTGMGGPKFKYDIDYIDDSSPAVASDGTIYVGTYPSKLYALNSDGTVKWSYSTGGDIRSSPAIGSDGTIYVGSSDAKLYAINSDGTLKWSYITGSAVNSSPAIGSDSTVYVGSVDNKLYAINANGTLRWSYTTGGAIACSPAVGSDGTIFVGSGDDKIYAINPNGTLKWSYTLDFQISNSSPAISSDGTIYAASLVRLYAINPNGTLKWSYNPGGSIQKSSPAIGSDGTIYVGSYDTKLYAINSDGTLKWTYATGYSLADNSPAISSDGTIYIGGDLASKKLYAINSDGTLKWSYTAGNGFCKSSPAIASDGTIYAGPNDGYLYAFESGTGAGLANSPWPKFHRDLQNTGALPRVFSITLSDTTVADGTTIGIPVFTSSLEDSVSSADIWVSYDSTYLSPTGQVDKGSLFSSFSLTSSFDTPNEVRIAMTSGSLVDVGATSEIVIVYFDVLQNSGSSAIGFTKGLINNGNITVDTSGATINFIPPPAEITLSDTIVSLGIIALDSSDAGVFTITNDGLGPLIVSSIESDNVAFTVTPSSVTLTPGDSQIVSVTFNPTRSGTDSTTITVESNDNTKSTLYVNITGTGGPKFKYATGSIYFSSPAIGSYGTVYVGSQDSSLYAINPDGTSRWSYATGAGVSFSSPAIGSDSTVYVGSDDNNLYAINSDGTLKWSYATGSYIYSSPAVANDGTIYVGSNDSTLYAINPDGTLKWSYSTGSAVYSSPAVGSDGTVYIGLSDGRLYALNSDGTDKWSYTTGGLINPSSPAIVSDGTVYIGSWDGILYAINPNGTLKWSYSTGNVVKSSPAVGADGTIYVGSNDGKLHAVNPNGTQKWSYTIGPPVESSPAVGSDGTIYVGSNTSRLHAINPDGTLKWHYNTGSTVSSSPSIASDGTVYVGSTDGYLYAFESGTGAGLADSLWPKFHKDLNNTGAASPKALEIALFPSSLSFSETHPDSSSTHTFTIINAGDTDDLVVSSIESDNVVFTVTPSSVTLTPGDS
jgi:large repetitive protein